MHIPSFEALFTSREKIVKTIQALCRKVSSGGSANGLATLDANGKVPAEQLPFVNCTQDEYDTMDSYDPNTYYFITDTGTVIHGG